MKFYMNLFIFSLLFNSAFICYAAGGPNDWQATKVFLPSSMNHAETTTSTTDQQITIQQFLSGYGIFKQAVNNYNDPKLTPADLPETELNLLFGLHSMKEAHQKISFGNQASDSKSDALQKMSEFLEQKQAPSAVQECEQRKSLFDTIWQDIKQLKKNLPSYHMNIFASDEASLHLSCSNLSLSDLSLSVNTSKSKSTKAHKLEPLFEKIINLAHLCKMTGGNKEKEKRIQEINAHLQDLITMIAVEENQGYKRILLLQDRKLNPNATSDEIDSLVHIVGMVSRVTLAKQNSNLESSVVIMNTDIEQGHYWSQDDTLSQISYINHLGVSDEIKIYLFQLMWWSLVKNHRLRQAYDISKRSPFLLQAKIFVPERRIIYLALQNIREKNNAAPLPNLTHLLPLIHTDNDSYYPIFYNHDMQGVYNEHLKDFLLALVKDEKIVNEKTVQAYEQFLKTLEQWVQNSKPTALKRTSAPSCGPTYDLEKIKTDLSQHIKKISEEDYLLIPPTKIKCEYDTEKQQQYIKKLQEANQETAQKISQNIANNTIIPAPESIYLNFLTERKKELEKLQTKVNSLSQKKYVDSEINSIQQNISTELDNINKKIASIQASKVLKLLQSPDIDDSSYITALCTLADYIKSNDNVVSGEIKKELCRAEQRAQAKKIAAKLYNKAELQDKLEKACIILIQYDEYKQFSKINTIIEEQRHFALLLRNKKNALTVIKTINEEHKDTPNINDIYINNLDGLTCYIEHTESCPLYIKTELLQKKHDFFLQKITKDYATLSPDALSKFKKSCEILGTYSLEKFAQTKKTIEEKEYAAYLLENINKNFEKIEQIGENLYLKPATTSTVSFYSSYINHLDMLAFYIDKDQKIPLHVKTELVNAKHTVILREILQWLSFLDEGSKTKLNKACAILSTYGLEEFIVITDDIARERTKIDSDLLNLIYFTSDKDYEALVIRIHEAYPRPEIDKEEKRKRLSLCDTKYLETQKMYQAAYRQIANQSAISKEILEKKRPIAAIHDEYIKVMSENVEQIAQRKGIFSTLWNLRADKKTINNFEHMNQQNFLPQNTFKTTIETKISDYHNKSWLGTIGESFSWLISCMFSYFYR